MLDLRFAEERTAHPPHATDVEVAHVPLFGRIDRGETQRIDGLIIAATDAATALRVMYVNALEIHPERIAAALEVVASGSERGGVLVHCAIGKDRTGIVSAFLLRLAGVDSDTVAGDYALSHDRIGPLIDGWIDEARGDDERERRRRLSSAPRGAMVGLLDDLEARFGGPAEYLRDAGLPGSTIDRLSALLQPG
jgi:protein-tyrosine phosphatase